MEKKFEILELNQKDGFADVISTDYSRLDEYVNQLEDTFKNINFKGVVSIDLLLSNGLSSNRFVEIPFDGIRFLFKKSITKKVSTQKIMDLSNSFLNKNSNLLNNSVLSRAEIFLIKQSLKVIS